MVENPIKMDDLGGTLFLVTAQMELIRLHPGSYRIPFRARPHIPPREKENHLQKCLYRGYASSQEGIFWMWHDVAPSQHFLVRMDSVLTGRDSTIPLYLPSLKLT